VNPYVLSIEKTKGWAYMLKTARFILIFNACVLTGMVVFAVFCRYILSTSVFGLEEIERVFTLWLYYVGCAYGSYEGSHIKGDLCSGLFRTPKRRRIYHMSTNIITFIAMVIWTVWGWYYVSWNFRMGGKTTIFEIPNIISQSSLYFAIVTLLLFSLMHIVKYAKTPLEEYEKELNFEKGVE